MIVDEMPAWAESHDVIVVGSGYAGLIAAGEAARGGLEVLVLEKMGVTGGNSRISGGGYCCWDSKLKLREKLGLGEDSWQLHYEDTMKAGKGYSDSKLVETMARQAPAGLDLLVDMGIEFRQTLARIGGHSAYRSYQMQSTGSKAMKRLEEWCLNGGKVEIRTNAEVAELYREIGSAGGVRGVGVASATGPVPLEARVGVVLATGGYARDVELRSAYNPLLGPEYNCSNQKGATGEVIQLAKGIGADTLHMEFVQLYPCANPKSGAVDRPAFLCYSGTGYGLIYVDGRGARFVNELASRAAVSQAQVEQGGKPTWSVLSPQILEDLGVSASEAAKLVERGGIVEASTAEELCAKTGFDPQTFKATLERHDRAVELLEDEDFGKPMTAQMRKLGGGPLYAIAQWPSVHYCMGGLRIDESAHVLDAWGKRIGGLFAAGEVCGGLHGMDRLGGNALAECVVFGRIAGQSVSASGPR